MKIITGSAVVTLLEDSEFQKKWDALYASCPWGTVFQSRAFVYHWYRLNQHHHHPILVLSYQNNTLVGLLPLTVPIQKFQESRFRNNRKRITGAGNYEAEYHVWLSTPEENDLFITTALQKVMDQFPEYDIKFRYIPAKTPVEWANNSAFGKKKCVLQPFSRPLMQMHHPEFDKILKKRSFKLKRNRLKREGKLEFKRILDSQSFSAILHELTIQFDFRQGAMFNKVSYHNQAQKSELLLALFKEGLLHVSLLTLDGKIIASIVAMITDKWIHLGGINTHSPFISQHSPGFVHYIFLGEQLLKENMEAFDLTPGDDYYKDRLATGVDTAYELMVTKSDIYRVKRIAKRIIYSILINAGIRPMDLELAIKKKETILQKRIKNIKENGPFQFFNQTRLQHKNQLDISRFNQAPPKELIPIEENNLSHLLAYNETGEYYTRWEFLEYAMKYLENGESCFTWVENGELKACLWLPKQHNNSNKIKQDQLNYRLYQKNLSAKAKAVFIENVVHRAGIVQSQMANNWIDFQTGSVTAILPLDRQNN